MIFLLNIYQLSSSLVLKVLVFLKLNICFYTYMYILDKINAQFIRGGRSSTRKIHVYFATVLWQSLVGTGETFIKFFLKAWLLPGLIFNYQYVVAAGQTQCLLPAQSMYVFTIYFSAFQSELTAATQNLSSHLKAYENTVFLKIRGLFVLCRSISEFCFHFLDLY